MKFRKNKIKREHSIIDGALDWLEELSKKKEVTDIIPGVIDVTRTPGKSIVYKYETPTGCKLLLKSGGSIQEAFVVTQNPEKVQEWVTSIMQELSLMEAAVNDQEGSKKKSLDDKSQDLRKQKNQTKTNSKDPKQTKVVTPKEEETLLKERHELLRGIKEEYQLVEINQGLRDSYVDSLASMADLDHPTLEEVLDPNVLNALETLQDSLLKKQQVSSLSQNNSTNNLKSSSKNNLRKTKK